MYGVGVVEEAAQSSVSCILLILKDHAESLGGASRGATAKQETQAFPKTCPSPVPANARPEPRHF